jgi:hypothetical protein
MIRQAGAQGYVFPDHALNPAETCFAEHFGRSHSLGWLISPVAD